MAIKLHSGISEDGTFSLTWMPDIAGDYTVYASFAGSNSYWPSHAMTTFVVDVAAATPAPTAAPTESVADMYFVPAIAGLFVAIIVVGLLIMLSLENDHKRYTTKNDIQQKTTYNKKNNFPLLFY